MFLLDSWIFKSILRITANILKEYFFYDKDSLARFFECFHETIEHEYFEFLDVADHDVKYILEHDCHARRDFTCYFVSYHLHDVLVNDLHFTEEELDHFENILPKFNNSEVGYVEQKSKRTNH